MPVVSQSTDVQVKPIFPKKAQTRSEQKYCAPCEDRTHDLQIMRLTRYLLR